MSINENVKNEFIKQVKLGKTLCLISDILIPVGLIATLFLYAFCFTVPAILIPGSVAIIGFILYDKGVVIQEKAKERLKDYIITRG